MSGVSYYNGMVTSHKMIENEMGNRGTKSNLKKKFVKAQRVDGNLCIVLNTMRIRCTLMGFERNYQVKILSKQINKLTFSTSTATLNPHTVPCTKKLNPWFITGFADAESSFGIFIQSSAERKTKWRVKAVFAIGLNKKDLAILQSIQFTFGVGKLYKSGTKVYYRVESFNELQVIVDHFDKYPLITAKIFDFLIFKSIVVLARKRLSTVNATASFAPTFPVGGKWI